MKDDFNRFLIRSGSSIKDALKTIDKAGTTISTLFVISNDDVLLGTLTDGDIRRGLIQGSTLDTTVDTIMQKEFKSVTVAALNDYSSELFRFRERDIRFVPVLDNGKIIRIIDLDYTLDVVPVDAFLLAGGKGERLLPATRDIPKPMIKIGDKPVIGHNVDRIARFGIQNIYISLNYLGEKIEEYFNGRESHVKIDFVRESKPMGTIGSIGLIKDMISEEILVMNSDLLTNIDFADFYRTFKKSGADMAVAVKPFFQDFPYAVIQIESDGKVSALQEKPRFTYYTNAGIYLIKKKMLSLIVDDFMDATDLMEKMIAGGHNVYSYPVLNYWLDIGKPEDLKKAQEDIRHLQL